MLVRQVEGKSHKYLMEFGLITGLKLCPLFKAPHPYSTRFVDTYFDGNKKIKNNKLKEIYLRLKRKELAEPNDLLKLSLIYLLEVGILGKESQVNIKFEHFSLVDDLDYFNQHPWGLESYNMLIASIHRALNMHEGRLNKSVMYSLFGCPLAFQVWGFETLPELGIVLTKNMDNTFPRILNWKGTKIFNEQSIIQLFHDFDESTHIVDSSNEEEEFYIANEYVPNTTHKRRRRHDTPIMNMNEGPTTETLIDYPNIFHEDNAHCHNDAGPSYASSDIQEVRRYLDSMEASYNSIQVTINQE